MGGGRRVAGGGARACCGGRQAGRGLERVEADGAVARGALGESARDGGCVALASVDVAHLAAAVRRLLDTPPELAALAHAARTRTFRSWSDYAATLTAWMQTLQRRS